MKNTLNFYNPGQLVKQISILLGDGRIRSTAGDGILQGGRNFDEEPGFSIFILEYMLKSVTCWRSSNFFWRAIHCVMRYPRYLSSKDGLLGFQDS